MPRSHDGAAVSGAVPMSRSTPDLEPRPSCPHGVKNRNNAMRSGVPRAGRARLVAPDNVETSLATSPGKCSAEAGLNDITPPMLTRSPVPPPTITPVLAWTSGDKPLSAPSQTPWLAGMDLQWGGARCYGLGLEGAPPSEGAPGIQRGRGCTPPLRNPSRYLPLQSPGALVAGATNTCQEAEARACRVRTRVEPVPPQQRNFATLSGGVTSHGSRQLSPRGKRHPLAGKTNEPTLDNGRGANTSARPQAPGCSPPSHGPITRGIRGRRASLEHAPPPPVKPFHGPNAVITGAHGQSPVESCRIKRKASSA